MLPVNIMQADNARQICLRIKLVFICALPISRMNAVIAYMRYSKKNHYAHEYNHAQHMNITFFKQCVKYIIPIFQIMRKICYADFSNNTQSILCRFFNNVQGALYAFFISVLFV